MANNNKNSPINSTVSPLGEAEKILEHILESSNISPEQLRQFIIKARHLIKVGALNLCLAEAWDTINRNA